MNPKKRKSLFAFVHIEKTAGMSLIHVLRRNFLFRFADVRPLFKTSNSVFQKSDLSLYLKINPFLSCISGHSVYPFVNLNKESLDIKFFTLLRDPVTRYISQFRYMHHINRIPMDFKLFLNDAKYHNFQTKKLSMHGDVDEAIEQIKTMFQVGTVEEFDCFLMRLKRLFSDYISFNPHYTVKNASPKNINADALYRTYAEAIIANNAKDIMLYDYVRKIDIPYRNEHFTGLDVEQQSFPTKKASLSYVNSYADYALRKLYYKPVTAFIRKRQGLKSSGSY